jgi:hypothetical protein
MSELNDNEKYISLLVQSLGKMDERFEELKEWKEQQTKIIENQNRLIELLSSRSVKQEKDIENLKWKQLETQTDIGSTVDALSAQFIKLEADVKELKASKDKEAS